MTFLRGFSSNVGPEVEAGAGGFSAPSLLALLLLLLL